MSSTRNRTFSLSGSNCYSEEIGFWLVQCINAAHTDHKTRHTTAKPYSHTSDVFNTAPAWACHSGDRAGITGEGAEEL
ncbi:MAG: hypothetical protein LBT81_01730, partial [Helicobacteraceae bacterium]|nr:hypothetical protein [Helicobacteraceae bacterium]